MKSPTVAVLLLTIAPVALAGGLELPPRRPSATGGAAFARSVADLPAAERERRVLAEVMAGNVPSLLRTFVPVTVEAGGHRARFEVAPDYLAVGSDEDGFRVPLTPSAAQGIADRLGCVLPTPKMVDAIHAQATVKLTPSPIPPTPAMTTVPVFLEHDETVRAQLAGKPAGALVAGHKKDVVIANRAFEKPGRVAIYGWHRLDGKPIQPLYAGHAATWVDYSHGIRLVSNRLTVDGEPRTVDAVLADPGLAPLLSGEGVMTRTRYPVAGFPGEPEPAPRAAPGEAVEAFRLDPAVRVVIDRPEPAGPGPVLLVLYALPNGNTIEQAIGKKVGPGDDWHFGIQQIGAQTRFLRERTPSRTLVVAYLENDLRGWPAWRKVYGDRAIPAVVDAVAARFPRPDTRLVLAGHSGGGSLTLGYLNAVEAIPDRVERVAFLDSNYAYETGRHRDKLASWLKASDDRRLVVLAYDDANALLDGKPFVSPSGGTWGRSRLMRDDLAGSFPFTSSTVAGLERATALGGRVSFLLKANPERKVLHTVQVERNGFIEAMLAGTTGEGVGYTYLGDRAYDGFLRAD